MTLCIAVHAQLAGEPRIILCFDSLTGNEYGVSEGTFKCDLEFAHGLAALWSGTIDQVQDALPVFKARFQIRPPTLQDCKEELWVGMKEFRAALVRRGIKRTDVQLIVAGYIEKIPRIIYVGSEGVNADPSFRAIGSGWPSADAMLRWRNPTQHTYLNDAIYITYEAKRFGETSPFVGKATTMLVLEPKPDSSFRSRALTAAARPIMEERFDKFGPQSFGNQHFHLPDGCVV
jgi:hypothetical protein